MNPCRFLIGTSFAAIASTVAAADIVLTEQFVTNVASFLEREIAAHMAAVPSIDPPPPLVLGVPTEGNFTWGSFMRAIAECSALSGRSNIAGRDVRYTFSRRCSMIFRHIVLFRRWHNG